MRRIVGIFSALSVAAAGLAMAAPAQASTTYTYSVNCQSGSPVTVSLAAVSGDVIVMNAGAGCRRVQVAASLVSSAGSVTVSPSGSLSLVGSNYTLTSGSDITSVSITLQITSPGGIYLDNNGATTPSLGTQITVTQGSPGPSPSPSSDTVAPAPALETLTLEVSTGNTTCTGGSPTGYSGSWLQLPAADACSQSGPNANPNAKLLGWATSSNFPIAIAQRQVDNGWGAYETFNDEGQLTGVFIPAGGWTFVSASGNLYPIWSS